MNRPSRYFAVRTTAGRELDVALVLENRVEALKKEGGEVDIRSIIVPPGQKGYVYIEAPTSRWIYKVIQDVKYVKRSPLVNVTREEILKLVKPKPIIEMINVNDIVEIVKGPFSNMKAKVISIDRNKNVVTLSILEVQFNVPITVPADYVKPAKKAGG
jgi:transcriptional antiterminator NusG